MRLRDDDKVYSVANLCPDDFETLLRLSKGRYRMIALGDRARASQAYDVFVEGELSEAELRELLLRNCDYPGSIRVRQVV